MKEEVGKVKLILDYYNGTDQYTDGDVENDILDIVQSGEDFDAAIERDGRWPVLYHLSKRRETIIQPMNISKTDTVLEIGSGCGALTGALAEKAQRVDCIELSKRRSLINAYRHKNYNNIRIIVANFNDVVFEDQYDVITLIGVLEYAGSYMKTDNPYLDLLKRVRDLIKPGGRLYIAIENRFGLKYFAGCSEDHTGREFDGIEGYHFSDKVRTFSKAELTELLYKAGYEKSRFFYPFPDYKLPTTIFSDEFLPKPGQLNEAGANYGQPRHQYFNEVIAFAHMKSGEDFKQFSNSYLIEVKTRGTE